LEMGLAAQRDHPERSGGLLSLVVPLEDMLSKVQAIEAMSQARGAKGEDANDAPTELMGLPPALPGSSSDPAVALLQQLVSQIERDSGKRCSAAIRWDGAGLSEGTRRKLSDIAIQLVRNAAIHGIEPAMTRSAGGKSPEGHIDVRLGANLHGQLELSVRDDGAGLSAKRIKERLAQLNWFSPQDLSAMSDQQAVSQIFKPGFSTETQVSPHAGRGVGLDAVNAWVREIGAKLRIGSQPGQFTEFRVVFEGSRT
jgi:two-component system, chemotaxis family, sensor kinase CheA